MFLSIIPALQYRSRITWIILIQHTIICFIYSIQTIGIAFLSNCIRTLWSINRRERTTTICCSWRQHPRCRCFTFMAIIIIWITIRLIVIPTHITRETRLWQTQFYLLTCLIIDSALCCMHILATRFFPCSLILFRRTFSRLCLKLDTTFYTTLIQRNLKRT